MLLLDILENTTYTYNSNVTYQPFVLTGYITCVCPHREGSDVWVLHPRDTVSTPWTNTVLGAYTRTVCIGTPIKTGIMSCWAKDKVICPTYIDIHIQFDTSWNCDVCGQW